METQVLDKDSKHLEQIIKAFENADKSTKALLRDSSMDELRHIFHNCTVSFLKDSVNRFTEMEEYEWCDKINKLIEEKEAKK